jgi:hypothetical protein
VNIGPPQSGYGKKVLFPEMRRGALFKKKLFIGTSQMKRMHATTRHSSHLSEILSQRL